MNVMRCVLVNDARLKADACCGYCGDAIAECYVREIGTRRVYCDQDCYGGAVGVPVPALKYHTQRSTAWRLIS